MEGLSCFGWTSSGGGGGGGTVTGANNGLHLFGTIVQLGGALILPTTVTATTTNFLDIVDSFGSFFKTRNALANFSIADFGGNSFVGVNTNIFSYLSTLNTYTNSNIVVNFGSVGNYVSAVDTWNFGDDSSFDSTSNSFNIGRQNSYTNTVNAFVFGNFNVLGGGTNLRIVGDSNVIDANAYVFGTGVNFTGNSGGGDGFIVGRNVNIDDTSSTFGNGDIFVFGSAVSVFGGQFVDSIVCLGFANSISATSQTRGVYMFGDSHSINDFATFSTLIGESCGFTRVDHVSSFGIFNFLTDVTFSYIFGEGNNLNDSTQITNIGIGNTIDTCTNVVVVGNANATASISNATIIGVGNVNALSSEILIAQNDLGIRIDVGGNVGVGVPYTETIKARSHIKGYDDTVFANQRLEPINNVYEDTIGNTVNTIDASNVAIQVIDIPTDTIIMIETYITCRKTAGLGVGVIGQGNGYIRSVKAQNIAGVVTIGIIQSSFTSESITAFNATFSVSGTNVNIVVVGALNDDVTWNSITKKYRVG